MAKNQTKVRDVKTVAALKLEENDKLHYFEGIGNKKPSFTCGTKHGYLKQDAYDFIVKNGEKALPRLGYAEFWSKEKKDWIKCVFLVNRIEKGAI